ncbi:hypothetical protein [Vibrio anguillarum]|uniref:hypothetical protein n=1 Tax=Vibrio anguillarum TaxID=55601 RepID=UPI0011DE865D|nr:hypothetical protein [Vibrio anguillarum]TYC93829.1 hypothetical protein FXB64_05395 [Vibrio anguillarum]TYC97382.1 hypothetical protein FXB62_03970 [Vibrio anguillarum]
MTKPNSNQAAAIAESIILDYVKATGCQSDKDIANVLEMLISKSARAIEKTNDRDKSLEVLFRTFNEINSNPMRVVKH